MIFNDSNLDTEAQKEYKQLREKVIEVEVIYNPTAKESVSLVFPDTSDIHKWIADFSIQLGIEI